MRVRNPDTRDELAEQFLRSTGADIREGHGEAYYLPGADYISLPRFEAFKNAAHFYSTAFHEVGHYAESPDYAALQRESLVVDVHFSAAYRHNQRRISAQYDGLV